MYFDLSDFLDSLKGLTKESAARSIEGEIDSLDEFHQKSKTDNATQRRTFTREYNFLKNLLQEINAPGKSNVKSIDREVVDEVLLNLKPSTRVKVIKKAKGNE